MAHRPRSEMTEDELLALVAQYIEQSQGYIGGQITNQRAQAMRYYQAQPFGDERAGHSQVILTDVADTIEWMLPQLLEPFVAGDQVVKFAPKGPEDIEAAEQETDYVNHVLMQDNPGFSILYTAFKDALLSKTGIMKAWAEQYQTVQEERYEGLTDFQLIELMNNPEVEVVAAEEHGQQQFGTLWDISIKRVRDHKRIRVAAIPPEHFMISRRATTIDDAQFVGHKERQTESELILEGHDPEMVRDLPSYDDDFSEERLERHSLDDEYPLSLEAAVERDASREIWTTECFVRVDWDGDGIAELRRIKIAGSLGSVVGAQGRGRTTMLVNDHWPHERAPYYAICPQPVTHKFFGMSIADMTMDIQHMRSTLARQMIDAQANANNPGVAAWFEKVEMQDLLVTRSGGRVIRTHGPPGEVLLPFSTSPANPATYQLLEFITGERESRTGVTKYGQGLDSASLNDTASGINQIMTAAQQRIKLIARLFAETGLTDLFRGLHELIRKYQDVPRTIRLRNRWVEIDPTDWSERMDTVIEVGLGASNKDLQRLHIDAIAMKQQAIIALQGGIDGPLVKAKHVKNMMDKSAELAGYKEPDLFCGDPAAPENQPEAKEQAPDPEMMKLQLDMQKAMQELQAKSQLEQAKLQAAGQEFQAEMQLKYEELAQKRQIEEAKLAQERQEMQEKLALEYAKLNVAREGQNMDVLDKQIARATADQGAFGSRATAAREGGSAREKAAAAEVEVEAARERATMAAAEVERLRAENLRLQGEQAGMSRTKRVSFERDRSDKLVGATVIEGPQTVQ